MTHIVVRIIELTVAIGLAAATAVIFALMVITLVHVLHSTARPR